MIASKAEDFSYVFTHFINICPSVTLSRILIRLGGTTLSKAGAVPAIPYPSVTGTIRRSEKQLLNRCCCIDQS